VFDLPGMRAMHWASAAPVEETIEDINFEAWLEDEAACQAPHEDPRNKVCSETVTSVFHNCLGPRVVCENTARYVEWVLEQPPTICLYCKATCHNHWRIEAA